MRDSQKESQNLDSLLAHLVDETISPEEMVDLERRLDGDPEAQRRYLHYLDLHADLVRVDGGEQAGPFIRRLRRRHWLAAGLAAAAAISVAAVILLREGEAPTPIVRVVDYDGSVRWMDDRGNGDTSIAAGSALTGGTLETLTPDSWAEVAFPDGTSLSLAGQSLITIALVDGQKVLRLREGNLSIEAAKQPPGRPLRVLTPSAEAEVLGTQFNVKADEFSARFVVNEGLVKVKRLADGSIEKVGADEVVVAALERDTEFSASPRRDFVENWRSELPRDRLQGRWEPGEDSHTGGLRAMPHLFRGDFGESRDPILLYSAVFDPSAGKLPPVRLAEGSRFLVTGRIDRRERLHVGFGTNRSRGGFVGKYHVPGKFKVDPDESGRFAFEIGLDAFQPMRDRFPDSPVGHEIDWLWVQTVKVDAGLVIESIELRQ
jgi:ferric-dicitrate binding protein FerR (iron transport regulator)